MFVGGVRCFGPISSHGHLEQRPPRSSNNAHHHPPSGGVGGRIRYHQETFGTSECCGGGGGGGGKKKTGPGALRGPWWDCHCTCQSRPYVVASAVLFIAGALWLALRIFMLLQKRDPETCVSCLSENPMGEVCDAICGWN